MVHYDDETNSYWIEEDIECDIESYKEYRNMTEEVLWRGEADYQKHNDEWESEDF